jgi:hypothetical protein
MYLPEIRMLYTKVILLFIICNHEMCWKSDIFITVIIAAFVVALLVSPCKFQDSTCKWVGRVAQSV